MDMITFKVDANEETLLQKQHRVQKAKKGFWKISKTFFALKSQILCLQHVLRGGANEEAFEKH